MSSASFVPLRRVITAITNANPAVVTATAHGYATNDVIRINVPGTYGMDLGSVQATLTVVDANSFSVDVDTSLMDAFVVPGLTAFTTAESLPISGETDNIA